jgi:hypothetical protein
MGASACSTETLRVICPALHTLHFLFSNVWRDTERHALGFVSLHRLLGARFVNHGRKLAVLQIEEYSHHPALSSKKALERVIRLQSVVDRVVVPPMPEDRATSEEF